MATDHQNARSYLGALLSEAGEAEILRRLEPKIGDPSPRLAGATHNTPRAIDARHCAAGLTEEARASLLDARTYEQRELYERHIENFIGTVKLPVGLAGPLRVNGLFAQGDYYVPLATTEAASYSRGAALISEAGGCAAALLNEGIRHAPGFAFRSIADAGRFVAWALDARDTFASCAASTTRHGTLADMQVTVEGNRVYLAFEFTTGDAAGQNMATLATDAICDFIERECPVRPEYHFLETNLSGDKKASAQSFVNVRGRKVTAEARLPADLVWRRLHTSARRMADYWRMSAIGGVLSGTIGVQGHYANGLAALYIACGQDAACVAESAVGVTRIEEADDGGLYAAVTLPNLIVGTVGGGTGLPSQRACLESLGLAGPGKAHAFAELCAAVALAGELSIIGALAAGQFARAHRRLAHGRSGPRDGTQGAAGDEQTAP
ncbi:MAG TPA: hydroxymethylglutaryl-CoA reductase [Chthonomonadaceae bacterium]|nr:hydroxymethylglutaryl-CoA reductase [Chthonomonadaceae bacterium]